MFFISFSYLAFTTIYETQSAPMTKFLLFFKYETNIFLLFNL